MLQGLVSLLYTIYTASWQWYKEIVVSSMVVPTILQSGQGKGAGYARLRPKQGLLQKA